jgi:hypothetical protein
VPASGVRGDIRPRSAPPRAPFIEFSRRFPAGTNRVRINDPRLKPGTWELCLRGTNSVGTGPVARVHVHVVSGG